MGIAPVRMFWKASSTLLASRAEVSMKERLFSPAATSASVSLFQLHSGIRTGKLLGFLCRHRSQMSQIALVSY